MKYWHFKSKYGVIFIFYFSANASTRGDNECDTCTETESIASNRRGRYPKNANTSVKLEIFVTRV